MLKQYKEFCGELAADVCIADVNECCVEIETDSSTVDSIVHSIDIEKLAERPNTVDRDDDEEENTENDIDNKKKIYWYVIKTYATNVRKHDSTMTDNTAVQDYSITM